MSNWLKIADEVGDKRSWIITSTGKSMEEKAYVSPWDQSEITDDAVRLHREGFSTSQIAKALNSRHGTTFSRNAVIGKLARLGLKRDAPVVAKRVILPTKPAAPQWSKAEIETMKLHRSLGADALSRLIKRSAKAIYRKASDLGIKLGGPSLARDDKPVQKPAFTYVSPFPERPAMVCEIVGGVPLLEAQRHHCRSVLGFRDGDYVFCGKTTQTEAGSWCKEHADLYIQPVKGTKDERNLKRSFTYHGHKGSEPRAW